MPSSTISSTTATDALELPPDPSGPPPGRWTPDHVGCRLVAAFATLDRLPRPRGPRPAGNHWPTHRVEWADQLAQADLPEAEKRARARQRVDTLVRAPSGKDIDRMDEALDWLRVLRARDAGLAELLSFWALYAARRRSVRAICRLRNWKPATFYYQRGRALDVLANWLEGRGVPVT